MILIIWNQQIHIAGDRIGKGLGCIALIRCYRGIVDLTGIYNNNRAAGCLGCRKHLIKIGVVCSAIEVGRAVARHSNVGSSLYLSEGKRAAHPVTIIRLHKELHRSAFGHIEGFAAVSTCGQRTVGSEALDIAIYGICDSNICFRGQLHRRDAIVIT